MDLQPIDEYHAYVGRDGKTEGDLLLDLVSDGNFQFSPHSNEPTVRMRCFFVVDSTGNLVSFEEPEFEDAFLHGVIVSWDGAGPGFLVGNIPVKKW